MIETDSGTLKTERKFTVSLLNLRNNGESGLENDKESRKSKQKRLGLEIL